MYFSRSHNDGDRDSETPLGIRTVQPSSSAILPSAYPTLDPRSPIRWRSGQPTVIP